VFAAAQGSEGKSVAKRQGKQKKESIWRPLSSKPRPQRLAADKGSGLASHLKATRSIGGAPDSPVVSVLMRGPQAANRDSVKKWKQKSKKRKSRNKSNYFRRSCGNGLPGKTSNDKVKASGYRREGSAFYAGEDSACTNSWKPIAIMGWGVENAIG